jgi:hypothetical protein
MRCRSGFAGLEVNPLSLELAIRLVLEIADLDARLLNGRDIGGFPKTQAVPALKISAAIPASKASNE